MARLGIGRAGLLALVLLGAACGDDAAPIFPELEQSEQPTATFEQPTTTLEQSTTTTEAPTTTTTTEAPTTTTTTEPEEDLDPFAIDDETIAAAIAAVEAIPVAERPPVPDEAAAELIRAELEDAGVDITGLGVSVWSFTEEGTLLLLDLDDSTGLVTQADEGDDTGVEAFWTTVFLGSAVGEAQVAQVAIRYRGADNQGPFELTMTTSLATPEAQEALRGGEQLSQDQWAVQLKREDGDA